MFSRFAMWFKIITLHSFWRILIFLIDIHSAKTRGIFSYVFFYEDVAPLVLCQKKNYSIFIILNLFSLDVLTVRVIICDFDR